VSEPEGAINSPNGKTQVFESEDTRFMRTGKTNIEE
jgi:hypothetical protein